MAGKKQTSSESIIGLVFENFNADHVPLPSVTDKEELEAMVESGQATLELMKKGDEIIEGQRYTYEQNGYECNVWFGIGRDQPSRTQLRSEVLGTKVYHEFYGGKLQHTIVAGSRGYGNNMILPNGRLTQYLVDDKDLLQQLHDHLTGEQA
jgi:hypothetical protein